MRKRRKPGRDDRVDERMEDLQETHPDDLPEEQPEKRDVLLEQRMRMELTERLREMELLTDDEIYGVIDEMILAEKSGLLQELRMRERMRTTLFNSVRGLDVLQELVDDSSVSEIMINGHRNIFVERDGKISRWNKVFMSESRLMDVIQQIAGQCNRVVNEQQPIVDARLQNGSRVNVVLPPVSLDGPVVTIRRFKDEVVTMPALVRWGSLTRQAADFLSEVVRAGYSVLVGGGTSTGKTTFLNALSNEIPKTERVITIEDNAELQIQGIDNLVRLEVRNANIEGTNEITMRDLIKTALRMRPTRLIIGETRGAEAADWLTCLNTGHDGSLGTAHANSVRDMIGRLEMMVLQGGSLELPIPVIRRQIASGIEVMVHLTRNRNGKRQVEEIAEVTGIQDDEVQIRTIFRRNSQGELVKESELLNQEKLEKMRRAEREQDETTEKKGRRETD